MTRQNRLTVLMITHKLREVEAFTDEVTVLRRGKLVGTGTVGKLTTTEMTEMMIGARQVPAAMQRTPLPAGAQRLAIRDLQALNDRGVLALRQLNLTLHAGEIVGIAGVSGNGQREFSRGPRRAAYAGGRYRRDRWTNVSGHAPADGPAQRLLPPGGTAAQRLCPTHECDRKPGVSPLRSPTPGAGWLVAPVRSHGACGPGSHCALSYCYAVAQAPIVNLSGGNVQRTVLARELSDAVEILLVANPCFGLDIAATAEIRSQIMAVRNRGAAVLLVSEDLNELLALADRILVMSNGQMVYETPIETADVATIGHHMAAH